MACGHKEIHHDKRERTSREDPCYQNCQFISLPTLYEPLVGKPSVQTPDSERDKLFRAVGKGCAPIGAGQDEPKRYARREQWKADRRHERIDLVQCGKGRKILLETHQLWFRLDALRLSEKKHTRAESKGRQADTDGYRYGMDSKDHPQKHGGKRCFDMTQREGDQKRQQGG